MDGTIHCRRWACVHAECVAVSSVNGLYGIIHRHILTRWTGRTCTANHVTVLYFHVQTVSTYGTIRKVDTSNVRSKTRLEFDACHIM